jgi:hypothetical protein
MNETKLRSLRHLIGEPVTLTVRRPLRYGYRPPEQTFIGNFLAIGHKIDGQHATCVVLDAIATGGGVPIVALRSVAELRAATPKEIREACERNVQEQLARADERDAARASAGEDA